MEGPEVTEPEKVRRETARIVQKLREELRRLEALITLHQTRTAAIEPDREEKPSTGRSPLSDRAE